MFSSRLDWSLRPNPISELLADLRRQGKEVLDLTESNPTQAGIVYPPGLMQAFAANDALRYEPSAVGLRSAREAVSRYYAGRVDPGRILLTASTSEAYAFLFKLLANPGDEILTPRPSYPLFEFLAKLESVQVVQYPLFYDHGWHIDTAALESLINERTRAIAVVNPNNPTGSYLKRAELQGLTDICARRGLALISDEVFASFPLTDDSDRVTTLSGVTDCLTFSMSGLSKIVGLPQMKLGWIVCNQPEAYERLEIIADTYLSVGTPVQIALPHLLAAEPDVNRQINARTRANLAWLQTQDLRTLHAEGGWYAILQVPRTRTEEEWVLQLLSEKGVLVQPGYFYDFESEAYLVLSLLTPSAIFREGVERLQAMLTSPRL